MRSLLFLLALLLVPAASAQRLRVTINDGWRFLDGTVPGAEQTGFADAAWQRVNLPHTWNATDAFEKTGTYRRGEGWYRRDLVLGAAHAGKRLFLFFEGANQVADVYVNGQHAGQHIGGYTAFSFDITDLVEVPGRNTIAVRVDNRHDDDIAPLNADFTFYGGIYRDVWLVATDPLHIDLLDYAGPGVYLDTPEITDDQATVRARVRVTNSSPGDASVQVVHRVLDAAGTEVARWEEPVDVAVGQTKISETTGVVPSPQRWSLDTPHLYRVVTEIVGENGQVRDRVEQPLGFRTIRVDGNGFYLNGQETMLTGTNRHQDAAEKGNALSDAAHRRDVQLVKETGFNFLRLAHYPQDPAVLEATDAAGLAVWEEIPVVNIITMSDAFADNAERMLVEMIRQHYNHPSVVMWGYMNEVLLRLPDPMPEGYVAAVRDLAQRLDDVAKREDPSRPTAMAFSNGEIENNSGLPEIADIFGMNLYFGWYYGKFEDLGALLDTLHARYPDRPLMVSEYGAGTDERVHAAKPVAFNFSVEHGEAFHRASLEQLLARPYMVGSAVWNQFDFGSSHRQDTKNALNQKGLYYLDRTPKDVAFYYQALLRDEPVLHLEREHRHRTVATCPRNAICGRSGPQKIQVYTNADSVVLRVNGVVVDEKVPERGRAVLDAHLFEGAHHVEAEGYWGNERRVDAATFYVTLRGDLSRPGSSIATNYGAAYSYTDATGIVYEAAIETSTRTHHRIYGTDDDPLFQAYAEGIEGANAEVPDGSYDVTLSFMEPHDVQPGDRVFDVTINGQTAIEVLDLAATAGRWTALTRKIRVDVTGGRLDIGFVPRAGKPILSSLLIVRR